MKDYMVIELGHVSEMVAIKVKVDDILNTFWILYTSMVRSLITTLKNTPMPLQPISNRSSSSLSVSPPNTPT